MKVNGSVCRATTVMGISRSAALFLALSALTLTGVAGCGSAPTGPQRFAISGTVTREGIPIDDGSIMFSPAAGGPAVMGQIVSGEYRFSEEDGVPAGKYAVNIIAKPLRDPSFTFKKNEAPIVKDDRFKREAPVEGWNQEAEVSATSTKLDFAVDP
ncbi:MAG: hypothetical protein R3C17_10160 [Planctomycetaceae bacterium]